jgi:Enoyl-(Acyl carrier protein) reductase
LRTRAAVFVGDLTRADDCRAMAEAALEAFGTVDVLVNNIAAATPGNVVESTIEDLDRVIDVSLRTAFLACKHVVPTMVEKGSGAIVNIGSIAAFRGGNYVGYAAAKGALHALEELGLEPHMRGLTWERPPPQERLESFWVFVICAVMGGRGRSATNCPFYGTEMWHWLRRPSFEDLIIR